MTPQQAMQASKKRDSRRQKCKYCGRLMAETADDELFDNQEGGPSGGERQDLCWEKLYPGDIFCKDFIEIHKIIDHMLEDGVSKEKIKKSILKALK